MSMLFKIYAARIEDLTEDLVWYKEHSQFWYARAKWWRDIGEPTEAQRCTTQAKRYQCKSQWLAQKLDDLTV